MVTLLSLASLAAVHYFTFEHPYLLADNRHYPFYVWKNIFKYVSLVVVWVVVMCSYVCACEECVLCGIAITTFFVYYECCGLNSPELLGRSNMLSVC